MPGMQVAEEDLQLVQETFAKLDPHSSGRLETMSPTKGELSP